MRRPLNPKYMFSPQQLKAELDKYVIGQEEAKRTLCVAVTNHYKAIAHNSKNPFDTRIEKSNIILAGHTGSGKTLLVRTIAEILNVPCYIQDCTKITQAGYVGSDVEDCLVGLLRACHYDTKKAEMGIVMLDEGDKMAARHAGPSITRDVSGEGVQQSLLKIIEGDRVGVPPMGGRKHPEQSLIYVDTHNILFILSGAFAGIEDIIKRRLTTDERAIGFDANASKQQLPKDDIFNHLTPQDLRRFGLIPEFVGRFPIITHVNRLEKADLVRILTEPNNAIVRQFQALFAMDKVDLQFTPEALDLIASIAIRNKTGARGLRAVLERVLEEAMFELVPSRKRTNKLFTITEDYIRQHLPSRLLAS